MRTIVIFNNKGGVGKTTACINISDALHSKGFRTLVTDLDPQANTTSTFGVDTDGKCSITDVLSKGSNHSIKEAIVSTSMGDIVPSDYDLNAIEKDIGGPRLALLGKKIQEVSNDYDFCIIDTPPNIGNFTLSALLCADEYILPICGDSDYAIDGIGNAFRSIADVLEINTTLKYDGLLMTKMDRRKTRSDVKNWNIIQESGSHLKPFSRPISVDANIGEAQRNKCSMQLKFPNSPASIDYRVIADEIINMYNK